MDMIRQECKYMPLAATQHPHFVDGVYKTPFKAMIMVHFPSSLFAMHDASFAAANSSEYCRDTVSFMLFLIHCAHQANVRVFIETLYDSVMCEAGIFECKGYRLHIPVPVGAYEEFAAVIATELESETEEDKKPKRKRRKVETNEAPRDYYVNRKRISSAGKFLDIVNRMFICHTGCTPSRLNLVLADTDAADGAEHFDLEDNTVYSVLDYKKHMCGQQALTWYSAMRLPEFQRNVDNYIDMDTDFAGGHFIIDKDLHCNDYEFAIRMLGPTDGFLRGDANNLRNFMQPSVEPTMTEVRKQLCVLAKNAGFKNRRQYSKLSDADTKAMFVSENPDEPPMLKDFAHSAPIVAQGPFSDAKGDTFSQKLEAQMYPLSYAQKVAYIQRRTDVIRLVKGGVLHTDEITRVQEEFVETVMEHLDTKCAGVPASYHNLWQERQEMLARMATTDTSVTRMARKMQFFASGHGEFKFIDEVYASFADTIVTHQNATPQQLRIILSITFFMFGVQKNEFCPQIGVCLQGSSDVGKSVCVKIALAAQAKCLQESENDASDKAWVADTENYMKIRWMDEMNFGHEKERNKSKDAKPMQAGMTTGVMYYNQYNLSRDGGSDTCNKIMRDCRGLWVATMNNELNSALRSRFVIIQTTQEAKETTGRKKIEKATSDPTNIQKQAAALSGQLWTSSMVKFWVVHCFGGVGIDFRMLEVFCALLATMLTPFGITEMMCRDIDKLRAQAQGVMVARVMAQIEKREELEEWADEPDNWINHVRLSGGVVSMKDIMLAFSLCKPTNAQCKMDHLVRVAMKRLVVITSGGVTAAETDATGRYYVLSTNKKNAASDLTDAVHRMGMDTNEDMMRTALTKLERTSHLKSPCIIYNSASVTNASQLCVLKCIVSNIDVMTDAETALVVWLQGVKDASARYTTGGLPENISAMSYDETAYMFSRSVHNAIAGTMAATNTALDTMARKLGDKMELAQRSTALFWLLEVTTHDGKPLIEIHTHDASEMFYRAFVKDTEVPGAEQCSDDGLFSGRYKTKMVMPQSIRVNKQALDTFTANQATKDTEAMKRHRQFIDVLMAVSGEAMPGDKIFLDVSPVIDKDTPAAVTHIVGAFDGNIVCKNPRRLEASSTGSHADIIEEDTVLPESSRTLTFSAGSRLYLQLLDEQSEINIGVPFADAAATVYAGTVNPYEHL